MFNIFGNMKESLNDIAPNLSDTYTPLRLLKRKEWNPDIKAMTFCKEIIIDAETATGPEEEVKKLTTELLAMQLRTMNKEINEYLWRHIDLSVPFTKQFVAIKRPYTVHEMATKDETIRKIVVVELGLDKEVK